MGAGGREEYCLETSYCEGTGEDELPESKPQVGKGIICIIGLVTNCKHNYKGEIQQ